MQIEEAALGQLLALRTQEVKRLLAGIAPVRALGKRRWFAWSQLVDCLEQRHVARLRRHDAEALSQAGSKLWVSGYAQLAAEWHPELNGELSPSQVSFGSQKAIWWCCAEDGAHVWRARPQSRVAGQGCPFCAGRRPSRSNCLLARAPAVAAEWHSKRNGKLTPLDVLWSSARSAWWQCPRERGHVWLARINNRTSAGSGCPHCWRERRRDRTPASGATRRTRR